MRRILQYVVAALLLMTLLAIFVSPATDVPLTALRAWQAALLVMLSILYAARHLLVRSLPEPLSVCFCVTSDRILPAKDVLALACIQRC